MKKYKQISKKQEQSRIFQSMKITRAQKRGLKHGTEGKSGQSIRLYGPSGIYDALYKEG